MTASPAAVRGGECITPMTSRDLIDVVELEIATHLSRWGYDGYAAELERPDAVLLVARAGGRSNPVLLGFIAARLTIDELHINNIAVRARHRRRGLGRALLREAIGRGVSLGAKWAVLEVRAGNEAALGAYGALGFEVIGRRRGYYSAPIEDAVVMGRSL